MGGGASYGLGAALKAVSEAELEALVQGLERADRQKLEVAMRSSRVDAATTEGSADVPKVVAEHKGGGEVTLPPLPQNHEDQIQLGIGMVQSGHQNKDQIQLGIRIVQDAHHNKVALLQQELRGFRLTCEEQRANIAALQNTQSSLDLLAEESKKTMSELDGVICELQSRIGQAVQSEDVSKLLHAKAILCSGLENASSMKSQDVKEEEEEEDVDAVPLAVRKLNGELVTIVSWGQKLTLPKLKYIVAEKAGVPSRSVKLLWNDPEPRELSTNEDLFEAHASLKSMQEQADAEVTSAPAPAEVTLVVVQKEPIDGKAFFREARSKLPNENFNQFLASIKRLNSQAQTREETLEECRRLFGEDHHTLFADFEELLNRHGM